MYFVDLLRVQKFSQIFLAYLTLKLGSAMTPLAVCGFTKFLALLGSEGGIHH